MKKWSKQLWIGLGVLVLTGFITVTADAKFSEQTQQCMECHGDLMPGILEQWQYSSHWQAGIGCYECHVAEKGDADAMDHNGFLVATIVSPKDCAKCHPKESAEQEASHHSKAGDILNTKDGLLGQTIGGEPAVAVGCRQCHGRIQEILDALAPAAEPAAPKPVAVKLTNIQKMKLIEETFEKEIRPMLKADGGDIELIDVEGDRVVVSLRGMCSSCSSSSFTLKKYIEPKLREFVSPDLHIEEVKP